MKLNQIIQHDISFFNIYNGKSDLKCCYMCRALIFKNLRIADFPFTAYEFDCACCFYKHGYTEVMIIDQNVYIDPVKYITI